MMFTSGDTYRLTISDRTEEWSLSHVDGETEIIDASDTLPLDRFSPFATAFFATLAERLATRPE